MSGAAARTAPSRALGLRRLRRRRIADDRVVAAVMMLPALVLLGLFFLWPFARGLWISVLRWDGFTEARFVGAANYLRLLRDPMFSQALSNSLIFVVAVLVLKNVLGLGLAMLLDRAVMLRSLTRAAVFVPVTMSFVAAGLLWSWIYNPIFGLLNAGLDLVGLSAWKRSWLGDADTALAAVIAVDIWKWTGCCHTCPRIKY